MADFFSWRFRVDRDGMPAGHFPTTPFPVIESTSTISVKSDEAPSGTTYTLGTLYFVDGARADDSGNGLSLATAKKTIGAAITAAGNGNKCIIVRGAHDAFDGVYAEAINWAALISGDPTGTDTTHRLMIVGYGDERPILDGTGLGTVNGFDLSGATDVTIQRFKVQDFGDRGVCVDPKVGYSICPTRVHLRDLWVYNCATAVTAGTTGLNGNIYIASASDSLPVDSCIVSHCTSEHTYGKGIKLADHVHDSIIEWCVTRECGIWTGIGADTTNRKIHPYGIDCAATSLAQHQYRTILRYNISYTTYFGNEVRFAESCSIHHNEFYDSMHYDDSLINATYTPYPQAGALHLQADLGGNDVYSNIFHDNDDTLRPWLLSFRAGANMTLADKVYDNLFYGAVPAGSSTLAALYFHYYSGEAYTRKWEVYNNSFYVSCSSNGVVYINTPESLATNVFTLKNNIVYQYGTGACWSVGTTYTTHTYNRSYYPSGSLGWTSSTGDVEGATDWVSLPAGDFDDLTDCVLDADDAGDDLSAVFTVDANGHTRATWNKGAFEGLLVDSAAADGLSAGDTGSGLAAFLAAGADGITGADEAAGDVASPGGTVTVSVVWLYGEPVLLLSSGTAPTVYWSYGQPLVIHEYVGAGGSTVEAVAEDGMTGADSTVAEGAYFVTASDGMVVADASSALAALLALAEDGGKFADASSVLAALLALAEDVGKFADATTTAGFIDAEAADGILGADAATALAALSAVAVEGVTVSESGAVTAILVAEARDGTTASDVAAGMAALLALAADALELTDYSTEDSTLPSGLATMTITSSAPAITVTVKVPSVTATARAPAITATAQG